MKWRVLGITALFLSVFVIMASAQSTDEPNVACVLTPNQGFANIRSAPDINSEVIGTVPSGSSANGLVATTDNAASIWYWVETGWVSQSAVEISDPCADVFLLTPLTEAPRQAVTILFQLGVSAGDADAYTDQIAIFGSSPRVPAVRIDQIALAESGENGAVICDADDCGEFTLFLFTPIPSSGGGLFPEPITPSAPRTPVPGGSSLLDALTGYTSPRDCLPVGQVCLVALLRAPSVESETCTAADFAARLSIPDDTPRATYFQPLTEVLREAGLQSLNGRRVPTRFLTPLGESDPCQLELLLPVSEPGAERFRLVEGGLQASFDVIRVTPPGGAGVE